MGAAENSRSVRTAARGEQRIHAMSPPVGRAKERARFRAHVDNALRAGSFEGAHGDGHYLWVRDSAADGTPGVTRVVAAPQALPERAAIDDRRIDRVNGERLYIRRREMFE